MSIDPITPVLFYIAPEGDVTAVLPTLEANWGRFVCYASLGQHSECLYTWVKEQREATPSEYRELLDELKGQGYDNLRVYHRITRNMPSWRGEPWKAQEKRNSSPPPAKG